MPQPHMRCVRLGSVREILHSFAAQFGSFTQYDYEART